MNKAIVVYYADGYYDEGDVGYIKFPYTETETTFVSGTKENTTYDKKGAISAAAEFIQSRMAHDPSRSISSYEVVDGEILTIKPVAVISKIDLVRN